MRILVAACKAGLPGDAIVVDMRARRIYCAGRLVYRAIGDSAVSFRLLALLLSAAAGPGKITHDQLLEGLWGDDAAGGPNAPRNYIASRLTRAPMRRALRLLGLSLENVWGEGFRVTHSEPAWRALANDLRPAAYGRRAP